jgi:hypothetical protein
MAGGENQYTMFTREEYLRAFELFLPPDLAVLEVKKLADTEALIQTVQSGDWQLSSDILYLLSLVSDDCRVRARRLSGLSEEQFSSHQRAFRARLKI